MFFYIYIDPSISPPSASTRNPRAVRLDTRAKIVVIDVDGIRCAAGDSTRLRAPVFGFTFQHVEDDLGLPADRCLVAQVVVQPAEAEP